MAAGTGADPEDPEAPLVGERLSIDLIRRQLTTERLGRRVCLYADVDSTNAVLRALARRGAADGTVVLAEAQRAGRGRPGKSWFSPPGLNLYVSVLLRPTRPPRELPLLGLTAALALTETIWAEGGPAAIKWPGDVLLDGGKVAGTLAETARDAGGALVVLGVGVNVNVDAAALQAALHEEAGRATSLRQCLGREIDRNAFTAAFLNRLERWVGEYDARGPAAVLDAWRERDALAGRRVGIRSGRERFEARAVGIDAAGHLVVDDAAGQRRHLASAEITLRD